MGTANGHWEGEALVVDNTGFNDESWFDRAGDFHSDQLHVVERFKLIDADHMNYEATIEDAQTFTRPWKINLVLYRHVEKNAQLTEFKCVEFAEELLYGDVRKKELSKETPMKSQSLFLVLSLRRCRWPLARPATPPKPRGAIPIYKASTPPTT